MDFSKLFPSAKKPFKVIKLAGYSSLNKENDYSVAKRPFMKKWQDPTLAGLTEQEADRWLRQGGWTGLVIPDAYIVIDIDEKKEGKAIFDALLAANFQFHAIETVRGFQFFFKTTGKVAGQDVKVLMAGGFIGDYRLAGKGQVVMPSVNTEGRSWIHTADGDLDGMPIFFEKLKKMPNEQDRPFSLPVKEGGRNNTLYSHSCRLIEFGYSQKEAVYITSFLNRYFFTPPIEQKEYLQTLRSAFQFRPSGVNYKAPEVSNRKKFHRTEMGNAERLVARKGEDLRYCVELEAWLLWDGSTWVEDKRKKVERIAIKTFREMYGEIHHLTNTDERKELWKWAQASERSSVFLNSIARAEAMLPVSQEELNRDPYKLNCQNGVVDLRTGELLEHQREFFMTKNTNVAYDPTAECPNWIAFLHNIFKDSNGQVKHELIEFIQRSIGYGLTGDTSEQVAFFFWGTGRNGKSTLMNTIKDLLGDYGKQTNSDTFTTKTYDGGVNNDIARLHGARMVSAVESDDGQKLSEALIKQLTGGEPIIARFLRREFFEFTPEFKIFFTTNHKPIVKGDDEGIWRRIRLIPFNYTIPKEEVDKHLPEKLQNELPGILNWAVEGCLKWQKDGLGEPEDVKAATDEYKEEMDLLSSFIEECCVVHTDTKIEASTLYKEYILWAEMNDEYAVKKRTFNNRMVMKGFRKRKSTGNKTYLFGIGLLNTSYQITENDHKKGKPPYRNENEGNRGKQSLLVTNPSKSNSEIVEEEI
ncbi:phage/plasmid primase, P4 family [Gracilibacillus xinjiangensis]|uniref:Phage/plasmid primase, P4 family n=1 Tax=Gracilibacillus xinjiangensis TaxID=1193282 RepID=A0ABV8WXI6_9BACI